MAMWVNAGDSSAFITWCCKTCPHPRLATARGVLRRPFPSHPSSLWLPPFLLQVPTFLWWGAFPLLRSCVSNRWNTSSCRPLLSETPVVFRKLWSRRRKGSWCQLSTYLGHGGCSQWTACAFQECRFGLEERKTWKYFYMDLRCQIEQEISLGHIRDKGKMSSVLCGARTQCPREVREASGSLLSAYNMIK